MRREKSALGLKKSRRERQRKMLVDHQEEKLKLLD